VGDRQWDAYACFQGEIHYHDSVSGISSALSLPPLPTASSVILSLVHSWTNQNIIDACLEQSLRQNPHAAPH